MNLKLENARYVNVYGTADNIRNNPKCFDVTVTDLDGIINDGKSFPYTYIDNDDDCDSKVKQYIRSKLEELDIAYHYVDPILELALLEYKYFATTDINDDVNLFINKYDGIYFNNDIFAYDINSITIINGIIDLYKSGIDSGTVNVDDISHEFISVTNDKHKLSYKQLIDLRNTMVSKYSEVKLYARKLKDEIEKATSVDEIRSIRWDLWDL